MIEHSTIAALRVLADAAELASRRPMPLVKQNQRNRILAEAIKLARETLLTETGTP